LRVLASNRVCFSNSQTGIIYTGKEHNRLVMLCWRLKVKRLNDVGLALLNKSSQSCGSHSITCHQTQVNSCQQTVTHPSSNRARCRATSLAETNVLTTTPRRHPGYEIHTFWKILFIMTVSGVTKQRCYKK